MPRKRGNDVTADVLGTPSVARDPRPGTGLYKLTPEWPGFDNKKTYKRGGRRILDLSLHPNPKGIYLSDVLVNDM